MRRARLASIALPDFGVPSAMPPLSPSLYAERLARLRARMSDAGYDRLLFYADREHSANISYLTGFDPRFEEALLMVAPDGAPLLLTGNECVGLGQAAPLDMRVELWQDLSLTGQPRDRSRPLAEIVADYRRTARQTGLAEPPPVRTRPVPRISRRLCSSRSS